MMSIKKGIILLIISSVITLTLGILIGEKLVEIAYDTTEDETTTYLIGCEKR